MDLAVAHTVAGDRVRAAAKLAATLAGGVVFGTVFKLLMKAIVMPLFGAPAINDSFHYLVGNTAALPAALYAVTVGAGFGEETLFRGYMFERFGRLLGPSGRAGTLTVVITSVWFGLSHDSLHGLPGVQQATIVGLVYGTIVAVTGRSGCRSSRMRRST